MNQFSLEFLLSRMKAIDSRLDTIESCAVRREELLEDLCDIPDEEEDE